MARTLDDLAKKLEVIENHLAEEVAPQVNELLKESVRFALIDWYNDYDPRSYIRTYNFMKILKGTRTSGKGNLLTLSIDSGYMDSYKGFDDPPYEEYVRKKLQPSTAFDYMWMEGEHGHGNWMMHKSIPPYMYVERDIADGFGGRLDKIVNKKIDEILRK